MFASKFSCTLYACGRLLDCFEFIRLAVRLVSVSKVFQILSDKIATIMPTFAELLTQHIENAGITHTRLADAIGVRRQTVFRWKEGLTARPRYRDDVLACAKQLRLNRDETNELLLAAGFQPLELPKPPIGLPNLPIPSDAVKLREEPTQPDRPLAEPEPPATPTSIVAALLNWPWVVLLPLCLIALITLGLLRGQGAIAPPTPSATPISSPTAMPTATQHPSPTPTPTPYPLLAQPDETLILVARFIGEGYYVNRRLREGLESEIAAAGLISTSVMLWEETVGDEVQAQRILTATQATMLVRGEYDQGRVRVDFSIRGRDTQLDWEHLLNSPDELTAVINGLVPNETRILALLSLGRLYRDEQAYSKAQRAFIQALELGPSEIDTEATLSFYLGYVSERSSPPDLIQAIDYYSDVLRLKPAWVNARYNRGTAYLNLTQSVPKSELGRQYLNKSIQDLGKVLQAKETQRAYLNRGIAYYERNESDDIRAALDDFDAAERLDDTTYRVYFNRALAYIRSNDPAWVADSLEALKLKPEHASVYNVLCWGYALDQQPEMALPYCDQALALGDSGNSRDGRGLVYAQLGRLDEAILEFEAYLEWIRTQPTELYEKYRGPMVETWITTLATDENPITANVLEDLR